MHEGIRLLDDGVRIDLALASYFDCMTATPVELTRGLEEKGFAFSHSL